MSNAIRWDAELIRRYHLADAPPCPSEDRQQPAETGSFELLHALRDSRRALRPLALQVQVPFCASACFHCQRNPLIAPAHDQVATYLQRLQREIELLACHLDKRQTVQQLQLTGGTPTYLDHDQLRALMQQLRRHFSLLDDDHGDYGVDVDPRQADWATLGLLRELGINRLNLCVEDLTARVQKAINRRQSPQQIRSLVEAARTLHFRSLGIELCHGLPCQTLEGFQRTLTEVIELQPDRIRLRAFRHQPERHVLQQRLEGGKLPGSELRQEIYRNSLEQLDAAGYRYIGLGVFALPDDDLAIAHEEGILSFGPQGFSTRGHLDLLGLGLGARSQIGETECANAEELETYLGQLDASQLPTRYGRPLDRCERIRGQLYETLARVGELPFSDLEAIGGQCFRDYLDQHRDELRQLAASGLIELDDASLRLLPGGQLALDALCRMFEPVAN